MKTDQYLHRCCPVCGPNTRLTAGFSSERAAEGMSFTELTPYWNGFFKEKIYFTYARCSKCDLLFAPIFYTPDQLEELYSQMAPNMDEVPLDALKKTQLGYFHFLKKFANLNSGYVEIGPDVGLFTDPCIQQGNFDMHWLFEPNQSVHDALRKVMQKKRSQIVSDMFGFSIIPNHSCGAAVMIQVLDHLLDPVATLSELREKMLPDSILLTVTHNERSLLRKVVGWKWPAFCLQHPQVYNPKSISNLLNKAGFEVVEIEKTKNYFELSFLLKHLLWAFGWKVKSVPSIFNFKIGLKLGNIVTLAKPS